MKDRGLLRVFLALNSPAQVGLKLSTLDERWEQILLDAPYRPGPFSEMFRLVKPDGTPVPVGLYLLRLFLDGERAGELSLLLS